MSNKPVSKEQIAQASRLYQQVADLYAEMIQPFEKPMVIYIDGDTPVAVLEKDRPPGTPIIARFKKEITVDGLTVFQWSCLFSRCVNYYTMEKHNPTNSPSGENLL